MGSISLLEDIKHKIIFSYNIIGPYPNKSLEPSDKVAPSEEVEKGVELWMILRSWWSWVILKLQNN